jgi:adenine-specific DNA-methyltransferase
MVDAICNQIEYYIGIIPKSSRKKYGQFFTNKSTAQYMASLFVIQNDKPILRILDAGAGSGILSIALLERISFGSFEGKIHLTCYENDKNILPLLKKNLCMAQRELDLDFDFEIIEDNYILYQSFEFNYNCNNENLKYDIVIGNPPYLKISKDAPEAKAMSAVCYGAPNMYFLFMSMGIYNLKEEGELVYIVPRSWTSGAYFKRFREYLLSECRIQQIHLFVSRNKVFDKEDVLQETIIIKLKKTRNNQDTVKISSSNSSKDFHNIITKDLSYDLVVSGVNHYIHLITDEKESSSLSIINKLPYTLPQLGLYMRTGIIVDFRSRELLRSEECSNSVPLFYSQHIQQGMVKFPIGKDNEYIVTDRAGFLQKNSNYLFVKRFTAKEEPRRLQCGIYLSKNYPQYKYISTQNKINFIEGDSPLSEEIIYGLYVMFNSTIYDLYYRVLNGSTQVNSTEINTLPVPSLDDIASMGRNLIKSNKLTESKCNEIINTYIHE